MAEFKVDHGKMADFGRADLPQPPPFTKSNIMAVIGPGTIALSMSIGSGEWLMGPAVASQYGTALLWITTVAVFLQVIFNQECARYVMYTGETAYSGFMRVAPGPMFWAVVIILIAFFGSGWPGWAAASASALFAAIFGHIPTAPDRGTMIALGYLSFALTFAVLLFGGTVERGLERISTFIVIWIAVLLIVFNVLFVSAGIWWKTFTGLFQFGYFPKGADWVLLGGFAAYSGAGGLGNVWTASWIRDKGFGMGSIVGAIPSAVGGREIALSKTGSIFDPAKGNNMSAWKTWWKYLHMDQTVLWGGGCIVGMYLCVLLGAGIIPEGTKLTGLGAGAYQAEYMAKVWGPFWFLSLFTGFWILWGTQLAVVDGVVRTVTDIIWTGTTWCHDRKNGQRIIYYTALAAFCIWGCIAINLAAPMVLLLINANVAGATFVLCSIMLIVMNYKFLPPQVRAPLWRELVLVAMVLFYGFFMLALIGKQTGWWAF
jgi:Mn2+/Fe2+ NRAMP family transporter